MLQPRIFNFLIHLSFADVFLMALSPKAAISNAHTLSEYLAHGGDHVNFQFEEPLLHLSAGLRGRDDIHKENHFTLRALHVRDVQDVGELQIGNALKALLQVRLHTGRGRGGEQSTSRISTSTVTSTVLKQ